MFTLLTSLGATIFFLKTLNRALNKFHRNFEHESIKALKLFDFVFYYHCYRSILDQNDIR